MNYMTSHSRDYSGAIEVHLQFKDQAEYLPQAYKHIGNKGNPKE